MPSYRFYKLTSGKRVAAPGEDHDFEGDLPAFAYARRLANGYAIGVWQGTRFVANVESEDSDTRGEQLTVRRAS